VGEQQPTQQDQEQSLLTQDLPPFMSETPATVDDLLPPSQTEGGKKGWSHSMILLLQEIYHSKRTHFKHAKHVWQNISI